MIIGKVVGPLKLSRGMSGAAHLKWVQVRTEHNVMVALDPIGVEREDLVLLAAGESVWRLCPEVPADAAVVGIVHCDGNNG